MINCKFKLSFSDQHFMDINVPAELVLKQCSFDISKKFLKSLVYAHMNFSQNIRAFRRTLILENIEIYSSSSETKNFQNTSLLNLENSIIECSGILESIEIVKCSLMFASSFTAGLLSLSDVRFLTIRKTNIVSNIFWNTRSSFISINNKN